MFGISTQLFSRSKAAGKRISGLVLSVFMLQVIAAGFCVPTVSAASVSQASNMEHCMTSSMDKQTMSMDASMAKHACAHCDMPDVNISLDKVSFNIADIAADFFVVAIVPTALDVEANTFVVSPPDLQTHYTSLSAYNLNLRIRV